MVRPSRIRRILKWTGAGLSLLILVTWIASLFCGYSAPPSRGTHWESFSGGFFIVKIGGKDLMPTVGPGTIDISAAYPPPHGFRTYAPTLSRSSLGLTAPKWLYNESKTQYTLTYAWSLVMPFWIPFVVVAIPTAWLWNRDRRRIRPGCCLRCGYDLIGNASGVCSECGTAKPPPLTV